MVVRSWTMTANLLSRPPGTAGRGAHATLPTCSSKLISSAPSQGQEQYLITTLLTLGVAAPVAWGSRGRDEPPLALPPLHRLDRDAQQRGGLCCTHRVLHDQRWTPLRTFSSTRVVLLVAVARMSDTRLHGRAPRRNRKAGNTAGRPGPSCAGTRPGLGQWRHLRPK